MTGILDFITEQNRSSALRDWASSQYGQSNPGLAALAQADPEMFKSVLPDIIKHEQEGKAISDYYGVTNQPQPEQGTPQDGDSALASMAQPRQDNSGAIKKLQAMAYLPSSLQSVAAQQMMFDGVPGQQQGQAQSDQTPEDFLKTLRPEIGNQVKAMVEGRMAPPSSFALKSPYWQQMISAASKVDPNFDMTAWKQRNDTIKDMVSSGGKGRTQINSMEMAINHLVHLQEQNKALGGWGSLNESVRNPIMEATNDPRLATYNNTAKNAADEMSKVMTGSSGGTGEDRSTRFKALSADAGSPEVREATIQNQIDLLMGKLEPMADSYNKAMGKAIKPLELLSPATQAALTKLRGGQASTFTDEQGNYAAQDRGPGAILEKPSGTAAPADNKDALIQELKRRGLMK